ncbi:MAG TPA: hypothetical protein VHX65_19840 [Pirellulales bacterium]|jgi:hypothetical protein|nr:hypothetical protein [Pirellulales bacterium]
MSSCVVDAYHEAGHAVVALALHCEVTRVDTYHKDGLVGVCRFRLGKKLALVERLSIDLAGMEAERQFSMYRGREYLSGSGGDIRSAARLLHENGIPADDDSKITEATELCRRLVGANWGAVARIAERLVTHREVSGALATAIYISHNRARLERECVT